MSAEIKSESIIYAYIRVSTPTEYFENQIDILRKKFPNAHICKEIVSTRKSQNELNSLIKIIKSGDTLVVCKLSCLAQNMSTLIQIVQILKQKSVYLISLKEGIDTSNSSTGSLVFNIMSAFFEFEREIIRERTIESLKVKRARGKMGGRPKTPPQKIARMLSDYNDGKLTISEILNLYGVSRTTLYSYIKKSSDFIF